MNGTDSIILLTCYTNILPSTMSIFIAKAINLPSILDIQVKSVCMLNE
jgi:hypothetical protein